MSGDHSRLYDFLKDIQLEQFFNRIWEELHVTRVTHFEHVYESDLAEMGMAKPEIRRLFDSWKKHKRKSFFSKLRVRFRIIESEIKRVGKPVVTNLLKNSIFKV